MIRDRGKMKWQGFMMPEHIKMLKKYEQEEKRETQPILDEQKVEEMNELISEAMEYNFSLIFELYNNRLGCFEFCEGKVHYIDVHNKHIRIIDDNEVVHQLHFNTIVDVIKD